LPEEHAAGVEFLRRERNESSARVQRSAYVVQRTRTTSRKKDLADIEALGEE